MKQTVKAAGQFIKNSFIARPFTSKPSLGLQFWLHRTVAEVAKTFGESQRVPKLTREFRYLRYSVAETLGEFRYAEIKCAETLGEFRYLKIKLLQTDSITWKTPSHTMFL